MHGHLHRVERYWSSEDSFGICIRRVSSPNRMGIETDVTLVAVSMRTEWERWEEIYPESVKSVKDRCIRVAPIDITTSAEI